MQEIRSPIKAIRAKCLDCSGGQKQEIKYCPIEQCPLFAFRFGKNPYLKRTYTEEEKAAMAERFRQNRKDSAKEL